VTRDARAIAELNIRTQQSAGAAAAAQDRARAVRRELEFGTPRNSKPRAASVPALEATFPAVPEPKSALKLAQSPRDPLASEKKVRVFSADEQERSIAASTGCFNLLRSKALQLRNRQNVHRETSPRELRAATTFGAGASSSSAAVVHPDVPLTGASFGQCTGGP